MWVQCWPQKAGNGFSCTGEKKAEGRERCQLAHSLMDPGPGGDAAAGMGQTGSGFKMGLDYMMDGGGRGERVPLSACHVQERKLIKIFEGWR